MKISRILFLLVTVGLWSSVTYSQGEKSKSGPSSESTKAFLGRWDLTLKAPGSRLSLLARTKRGKWTTQG